jgi:hypothetical protein
MRIGQATTNPSDWNTGDVAAITTFLSQPDEGGVTNAQKLLVTSHASSTWNSYFHFNTAGRLVSIEVREGPNRLSVSANLHGSISFPGCIELRAIRFANNSFTSIDVSENTNLMVIDVRNNNLRELEVLDHPFLTRIDAGDNELEDLDVTGAGELRQLYLRNNELTEINVSDNPKLEVLDVDNNGLGELIVTESPELWELRAAGNNLTSLDVSENVRLMLLFVHGNPLAYTTQIEPIRAVHLDPSNPVQRFGFTYTRNNELWFEAVEQRADVPFMLEVRILIDFMPTFFDPWFVAPSSSGQLNLRFDGWHLHHGFNHMLDNYEVLTSVGFRTGDGDIEVETTHVGGWSRTDILFTLDNTVWGLEARPSLLLDFTNPCGDCNGKICECPCETCDVFPCDCPELCPINCPCEECTTSRNLNQSLAKVSTEVKDGEVTLVSVDDVFVFDEDFIKEWDLSFRWYRRVGENGAWVRVETLPDQTSVAVQTNANHEVGYKVYIFAGGEVTHRVYRQESIPPPDQSPNFVRDYIVWSVTGVLAITGALFMAVSLNKHDPSLKKSKKSKKEETA